MASSTAKLEKLIGQYEAEIFGEADSDALDVLCRKVEDEADRIGYANHSRLMALHTMAESAALTEARP